MTKELKSQERKIEVLTMLQAVAREYKISHNRELSLIDLVLHSDKLLQKVSESVQARRYALRKSSDEAKPAPHYSPIELIANTIRRDLGLNRCLNRPHLPGEYIHDNSPVSD